MQLHEFLEAAKAYKALGWSIQEQLHGVVDEGIDLGESEYNGNALRIIKDDFIPSARRAGVDEDDLAQLEEDLTFLIEGPAEPEE